ncbi:iron-sulfur cluster repair di-iron protein [Parapedobacter lycopersici]|uniref:iron-sulfur cluster repair di-iron protein n=1 Tax=Parapedobacter lycopersici TaxID=1864939 RepID=UPI00333E5747
MEITTQHTVGQVVARDYRSAAVFSKAGIDFCCGGNRTIDEACQQAGVAPAPLIDALKAALTTDQGTGENDYDAWPLDMLADHIEDTHHRYVESRISEITPLLQKIKTVHGDRHPELARIMDLFTEAGGELTLHMKKEELMLFPFIRRMAQAQRQGEPLPPSRFGTVANPIAMMEHDHDGEGERFRQIAALSGNYTPPSDACNTYRVTLALLQEFEADLHLHIHLENNILFPKAVQMESELSS